ncbi:recombinase family protein [Arthrobacter sp. LjRoot14]|uniref:recombinase family protein n=1 Tax=Arthrobacter sp. LjRoot14 TaxID=3342265 RepID=UPI003F4FDF21
MTFSHDPSTNGYSAEPHPAGTSTPDTSQPRDSKADGAQTTDLQRDALLASGIDADSLYEDRASGKKADRPQLAACLKALRRGDTLVVCRDRCDERVADGLDERMTTSRG